MRFVTSIGLRLGKRVVPIQLPEISGYVDPTLSKSDLLRIKNALIPEAGFSQNLLFELPSIPFKQPEFTFTPADSHTFDIDLEISEADDDVGILDGTVAGLLEVPIECDSIISENLFVPLLRQIVTGKNYTRKAGTQSDLFPSPDKKDEAGFVKAYKRQRTPGSVSSYETKTLSVWDLLFPVLLPPIADEFDQQFELFKPLYKFQPSGIEFLIGNESALLADEMGTGKTVMTSVALKLLFRLGRAKKALVVCPVSLLRTWQDHLIDWANELQITVVRGAPDLRKLDWKYPAHIYLATYDTIASDFFTKVKRGSVFNCPECERRVNLEDQIFVEDTEMPSFRCPHCSCFLNEFLLTRLPKKPSIVDEELAKSFDVVVLDEAQYIKNSGSQRSRAVRIFSPDFKWALTGTPIENRLDDLVSIFKFLKPELMKSEPFLTPSRAVQLIEPHFLRRLKKDVMKDLPPKVEQKMWLELDIDQRREYDEVERSGVIEIGNLDSVTKIHIFALISKLKQICNFATGKVGSAKTVELIDLVEQIKANGQKVLVFSQYDGQGVAKLEPLLQKYGVVVLKGGMSDASRNLTISRFKNDPQICVFLATIKTGGVGLTLTEASYVIHFDHWWNPASMWQATDRVHRTGQLASQVNIYSFWAQNTIEEKIHSILETKGILFDEVINGLSEDAIDTMISTDEWLEILGVKPKRNKSLES